MATELLTNQKVCYSVGSNKQQFNSLVPGKVADIFKYQVHGHGRELLLKMKRVFQRFL